MKSIILTNQILEQVTSVRLEVLNIDKYNDEYEGVDVKIGDLIGKVRTAKKTPRKQGYFVTLWKKDEQGKNIPYAKDDLFDILIIHIEDSNQTGQFVFSKNKLIKEGILKSEKHQGKMGFRVYATWDTNLNKTAEKTAAWQKESFIDSSKIDNDVVRYLYKI